MSHTISVCKNGHPQIGRVVKVYTIRLGRFTTTRRICRKCACQSARRFYRRQINSEVSDEIFPKITRNEHRSLDRAIRRIERGLPVLVEA